MNAQQARQEARSAAPQVVNRIYQEVITDVSQASRLGSMGVFTSSLNSQVEEDLREQVIKRLEAEGFRVTAHNNTQYHVSWKDAK